MRKYCAVLLALLLFCAATPVALASDMYDTYGDMDYWDDATWELSYEWSDEQWEDYWQGAEEVYQQERAQELRSQREKLGLPNLDGANVKFNDHFFTFEKAQPYVENSSLYLPLRAFLAACGLEAQISYDATTGIAQATLADGRKLTATLGQNEMQAMAADGEEYTLSLYDPPRMIEGAFYIEQEGLCDFLGWDAQWDYYNEILYIVDSEALIEQINSHFAIYNRLLKMQSFELDMQQAYKISGSFALSGTLYGDDKDDIAKASLEFNGITKGFNADINFASTLDLDQLRNSLLSQVPSEDWLLIKALASGKGRLILNSEEGEAYLQSNLLPLLDKRLGNQDWLWLESGLTAEDITDIFTMMIEQFSEMSMGSLIYDSSYSNGYYGGGRDIYADVLRQAKLMQALLGDENFKQETKNGYTVYTLEPDQAKLKTVIEESQVDLPAGDMFSSLFGYLGYGMDSEGAAAISMDLTLREKDAKLTDMQLNLQITTQGYLPVTYTVVMDYNDSHAKANIELKARYGGKINVDINYEFTPVEETPATAPPEGSRVIPPQELNSQRLFWF